MGSEAREARREQLIRDIVRTTLDDPQFRSTMREIVLLTVSETERMREQGLIHSFFQLCHQRGVFLRVDEHGKMLVNDFSKMGAALEATLRLNKQLIWEHLVRERDAKHRPPLRLAR